MPVWLERELPEALPHLKEEDRFSEETAAAAGQRPGSGRECRDPDRGRKFPPCRRPGR